MQAIIAALIAALVPVLAKLLTDWLNKLFNKVAPEVTASGDAAADAIALVSAGLDATPRTRIFKRALLRKIRDHAADIVSGDKLSKGDRAELVALAAKAKSE